MPADPDQFATQANRLPLKLRLLKAAIAGASIIAPQAVAQYGFNLFITPKRRPISEKQRRFLETGEQFTIPYQSQQLVAYRWGQGPIVLLVHGWQANAATMQYFVNPLVEAGYQVVAMDGPAHGASPGTQLHLLQYGDAVLSAINALGGVHAIIAHSVGGASVATMLGTHLHFRIDKVVLVGAVDKLTSMLDRYAEGFGLSAGVRHAMDTVIESRLGHPPQFYSNPDLLADFPRPVLVVHDRNDDIVPFAAAEAITNNVKSSRLLATNGLGHRRILRDEDTIHQIVEFIRE